MVTLAPEFSLEGLIGCCGSEMSAVSWRGTRQYTCRLCGRRVDALAAEAEVAGLVSASRPELAGEVSPPERCGHLLSRLLKGIAITTATPPFQLHWRHSEPYHVR